MGGALLQEFGRFSYFSEVSVCAAPGPQLFHKGSLKMTATLCIEQCSVRVVEIAKDKCRYTAECEYVGGRKTVSS